MGWGAPYLRHRILSALLQRNGLIPDELIAFLNYADSQAIMRRAGGGYLFIHRLLQDYFAGQVQVDSSGAPIELKGSTK
jgi:hypothetical protein